MVIRYRVTFLVDYNPYDLEIDQSYVFRIEQTYIMELFVSVAHG
nr:MAG: hypothetical protein H4BulkLitter24556_000002 [Mitovirus sp.]